MKRKRPYLWPYLLIAPALLIVLTVVFYPIINTISMSFQNYNLLQPKRIGFIGLDNYIEVLTNEKFWVSLWKTIVWVVAGVGLQFVFGFILAGLLNNKFPLRGLVRSVSLIPWVTPGVLIALMWTWMYDGNSGVLNDLLLKVGLVDKAVPFLAQAKTAFPAVILTIIWQGIPFFALMILAGLQGIPGELYEAADIDGASGPQKLFRITIPSLKNTLFVTTLLRIIWVANSVDVIYNMTSGGPGYATSTLSIYTFVEAQSLNMGYASTLSLMLTLVLLTVAIPYLRNMFKAQEN
ncbi:MAG: multiple sugar transport system permease protein [Clostridiales bacterium]|jgi:multiple sugar transport system permease protein|nr:sugar ABC transporter permease [Eubacteriales bacterium]MDD3198405.1 sugar ABC transporter permease [Eubacteriales bacterium]MDD4683511.1 sugar ABC transporter permease [Eubacteriales bacterium]MDN5314876.1 multiple sugar transport system permease protein [Clostridiales bacterium]